MRNLVPVDTQPDQEQGERGDLIEVRRDGGDVRILGYIAALAEQGIEPEKPPYAPGGRGEVGRICFVADPDGYRVELIDGGRFPTPQDP